MVRSLTVLAAVVLAVSAAQADDVEKAEQKLAKAREAYSSAMTEIRDEVLKQIDAKDTAERKQVNPDLAKLKVLKAEKDALKVEGELPKWVEIKTKDRITNARRPLVAALTEAKAAYVRAQEDEKAAAIDKELEQVKKGGGAVQAGRDALQKGTVWKGERTFTKGAAAGKSGEFELNVTARSGKKFSGFTATHDVEGTIEDGKIEWKVIRQRNGTNPGQPYKGELQDGTLLLTFEGMGAGGPNAGTAKLVLQKPK